MARSYRFEAENTFYHLTNRGDDRKKIYVSEFDHRKFLEYVLQAKKRFKFRLYAYVLMSNHYHLLIETLQANLSKVMHFINSAYTTYYNVKRKRTGHLFQGRYKSIVVDKDNYFLELTRYVHLNPVRAGIVKRPEEYRWSSYKGYVGRGRDRYIDRDAIRLTTDLWGKSYADFVMTSIDEKTELFKNVYGGIILGKPKFIKERLKELKGQVAGTHISHKNDLSGYVAKEDILALIEKEYGKDLGQLRVRTRGEKARKMTICLMRELTGFTNSEIGDFLRMNYSAVSKAALAIEKDKSLKREAVRLISNFEA